MQLLRYRVPITELSKHVKPLTGRLWGCDPIHPDEIGSAVENNQFEDCPWDSVKDQMHGPDSRDFHIARIAYLVVNGWPSDKHSIRLVLDQQSDGSPIGIDNGNHRIAAAQIRGDTHIEALLYVFDEKDIAQLLPEAIPV